MDEARVRWNSLAKPLGSLGLLEEAIVQIAALKGDANVDLSRRTLLVMCADNGVVAQGVTQTDSSVTAAVARALGEGTSTVCHMAHVADCQVLPVDVGILNFPGAPGVLDRRVRNGTADMTQGPAMSREECIQAIQTGMALVKEQKAVGVSILAAGEMGIGNTTTSSAAAAVLLGVRQSSWWAGAPDCPTPVWLENGRPWSRPFKSTAPTPLIRWTCCPRWAGLTWPRYAACILGAQNTGSRCCWMVSSAQWPLCVRCGCGRTLQKR